MNGEATSAQEEEFNRYRRNSAVGGDELQQIQSWQSNNLSGENARTSEINRISSTDSDAAAVHAEVTIFRPPKPKLSWVQRIFGIGPNKRGIEGSKIIHPQSPFAQTLSCFSTLLLSYVACSTPITIGFFWTADGCTELPTLKMDMFVDCFFLAEIIYNFFVGITHEGIYRDDLKLVAKVYLRSSFFFDVLTSIPVAVIEYVTIQACFDGSEPSVETAQLRIVRATKPFRIFKMIRILKTSRLVLVFDWLESEMRPPPFVTRVLRIFCIIAMIVHVCVCAFWLIKDAFDEDGAVYEFLDDNGLSANPKLIDKYMLGMYFVNTVFTTVGFGDIVAINGAERVFYVTVMYVGTLVFGAMLGEVQAAMAQLRRAERERSEAVLDAKDYLREVGAAPKLERILLRWVNFDFDCKRRQIRRSAMQTKFPPLLRRELAQHNHRDMLTRLPVFNEMRHPDRENFFLELYMKMESSTACAGHALALAGESADRMHILLQGSIKVTLGPTPKESPAVANMIPGDHIGEYSLFEETSWMTSQGKPASFWCETHVECLTLTREDFLSVVSRYPAGLEAEVFYLADMAHEVRDRTAEIDDLQQLRWCQVLYKVLRRIRIASKGKAHSNKAIFSMALHRQKNANVRKSSILLASRPNSFHTATEDDEPSTPQSPSNPAYGAVGRVWGRRSFPPKLGEISRAEDGEEEEEEARTRSSASRRRWAEQEELSVSKRLDGIEQLMLRMSSDAERHREMMSERMQALESRLLEQQKRATVIYSSAPDTVAVFDGADGTVHGLENVTRTSSARSTGRPRRSLEQRDGDGARERSEQNTLASRARKNSIAIDTVSTERKSPAAFEQALFEHGSVQHRPGVIPGPGQEEESEADSGPSVLGRGWA